MVTGEEIAWRSGQLLWVGRWWAWLTRVAHWCLGGVGDLVGWDRIDGVVSCVVVTLRTIDHEPT